MIMMSVIKEYEGYYTLFWKQNKNSNKNKNFPEGGQRKTTKKGENKPNLTSTSELKIW